MRRFLILMLLFVNSTIINAQNISGSWYGNLQLNGANLRLVFHISEQNGVYSSTMDSPDQKAFGLPTDQTTFKENLLIIEASKFSILYSGKYNSNSNTIEGLFKQGVGSTPLLLSRDSLVKSAAKQLRPQDPINYPYKVEDVTIKSKGGVVLSGTLTIPENKKANKIVILITGSGPQDRNEEISQFNHRPFLVWSDFLTREGIAVLRYDDRGFAKSTGNFAVATTADFADDVEAAINFIKTNDAVKNLSIGLIGHSEGGMIAPMVAARNKSVDFIVLLAGPGIPIKKLMLKQTDDQARLNKVPADIALLNHNTADSIFTFLSMARGLPEEQIRAGELRVMTNSISNYMPEMFGNSSPKEIIEKQLQAYNTPWFRYFISFKPEEYLSKVSCPVLALNGTLDSQVSCNENLEGIKKSLILGKNKYYKIEPLKDLNHMLQKCNTGGVEEYGAITETVNPVALNTVSNWIKNIK